jgi:ATP-dependent DNA helicase DinG
LTVPPLCYTLGVAPARAPFEARVEAALRRATAGLAGGGEDRPGQVEMTRAVARGLDRRRHVVVQAGTGTGKSLAYLVPLALAGRPGIVATATKGLQDQLADRELPFLAGALESDLTFAVLKGRSNYLCRQRLDEVVAAPAQLEGVGDGSLGEGDDGPTDGAGVGALGREVSRLIEWSQRTGTGDRAELDFEPRPRAWQAVSVTAAECPGAVRCPRGEDCFAEEARRRAAAADVVVVNTHLYGAHLASGGMVLPEHDVVIFDEAHELEDVVASSLGLELGPGRLRALARTARVVVGGDGRAVVDGVEDGADRLEMALEGLLGTRLPTDGLPPELAGALAVATGRVEALLAAVRGVGEDSQAKARALQAAGRLVEELQTFTALDDSRVAWVERSDRSPLLRVAPIEVGPLLAEGLWPHVTAVLTSATIPARLAERIGLPPGEFDQLDAGSPFPYQEHALLYCAAHLPDPRQGGYEDALHEELQALVTAAGGRTLALFTSWRAMHAAADALRDRLPGPVLTQADLPKPALLAAFSGEEATSLFATLGFFQGVDVPGRSLSLVTVDRLPFSRPDDPLVQARRDRAGERAFQLVDLPRAATLLAQAAGRLIRTATDRGVVAVFDRRLATATYRWELVNALPPMRRTRHRAEAEAFLQEVTAL